MDIDLDKLENDRWTYGRCAVFVRSLDHSRVDTFRMVDVANTANRILSKCVLGKKYPYGGTAGIGSSERNFFVALGGLSETRLTNETVLVLPSKD